MKKILLVILIFILIISFAKIVFSANYILSGKMTDSLNSPLQAKISAGSLSTTTTSNGNYVLTIAQGTYNINYSLQNLWISLPSFNLDSNKMNLVNFIYQSNKKVSFNINMSQEQTVQVSSSDKPIRVQINGTLISEVSSLSSLTANTWFYDSAGKRLYTKAATSDQECNFQCQSRGYDYGICRAETTTCSGEWIQGVCDTGNCCCSRTAEQQTEGPVLPPSTVPAVVPPAGPTVYVDDVLGSSSGDGSSSSPFKTISQGLS
ncbi:MAG TPA: hypothetical protein VJ343_02450, partial [archaeon]|nr:hypothetical protein [archaeon]